MDCVTFFRRVSLRPLVWIFFALTLVLGLWIAQDYGISWDEKAMFVLGEEAYEYVTLGEAYPSHIGIRYHGSFIEILLYAAQEALHLRYARHVFIFRHAVGFLVFWGGMLSLYALAHRHFRHRGWALLVALLFFLSPRQFGHSFVNTRDIPSMVFFIVMILTLLYFLDRKTLRSAMLHGIASGMVVAIRVGGLFAPIFTALFLLLEIYRDHAQGKAIPWKRYGAIIATYGVVFACSIVLFWPLLWEKPMLHFYEAMHNMMTSQQVPGGLYLGEHVGYAPWHWVPVHFLTKTPLVIVVPFFVGIGFLLNSVLRQPLSLSTDRRNLLLFFSWVCIPLFIVIALKADLFDEWRHLYFLYPAVLLLAVHGVRELVRTLSTSASRMLRVIAMTTVWGSLTMGLLTTAYWMVRNHPLQYVYFSIPSKYVEFNFELDYWGLAYRQAFEWVLANDPDEFVTVTVTSSPGWENLNILTREQRRRLVLSKRYTSKYVLDNFDWQGYRHTLPAETIVHSVMVSGISVLHVYRNPFWEHEDIEPRDIMETEKVQMWFDKKSGL